EPGGEGQRLAPLQAADHLFERLPGRIARAAVVDRTAGEVGRRERHRLDDLGASLTGWPPQGHGARGGGEVDVVARKSFHGRRIDRRYSQPWLVRTTSATLRPTGAGGPGA